MSISRLCGFPATSAFSFLLSKSLSPSGHHSWPLWCFPRRRSGPLVRALADFYAFLCGADGAPRSRVPHFLNPKSLFQKIARGDSANRCASAQTLASSIDFRMISSRDGFVFFFIKLFTLHRFPAATSRAPRDRRAETQTAARSHDPQLLHTPLPL